MGGIIFWPRTFNYAAIEASSDIAAEKGSYAHFAGSDWDTGVYFAKRGYNSPEWKDLAKKVHNQGMRNSYLLAIAPTSSTSQKWSIRSCGVRQRHIDQAQSMNLYITNEFTMRQVLDLYLLAWESGVKTVYYVRSKSLEVEECESCSS